MVLKYQSLWYNLGKLTASHFQVLNTQNANKNLPNMFLIVYLNENFIHPYVFWYTTKGEKVAKTSFYFSFM